MPAHCATMFSSTKPPRSFQEPSSASASWAAATHAECGLGPPAWRPCPSANRAASVVHRPLSITLPRMGTLPVSHGSELAPRPRKWQPVCVCVSHADRAATDSATSLEVVPSAPPSIRVRCVATSPGQHTGRPHLQSSNTMSTALVATLYTTHWGSPVGQLLNFAERTAVVKNSPRWKQTQRSRTGVAGTTRPNARGTSPKMALISKSGSFMIWGPRLRPMGTTEASSKKPARNKGNTWGAMPTPTE